MSAPLRLAALAGWGHRAACWDRLAVAGAELAPVCLPGHEPGPGAPAPDCSLAAAAGTLAGDWDVVMGWSLGGLAAVEAVRRGLVRPRGLVLVATPPSFLARPGYPAGQAPQVLAEFRAGLAREPLATLRRFYTLQFRGDRAPRSLWSPARARDRYLATAADPEGLAAWLDVLAAADLSAAPPALELPVLAIHGDADAVVDPAALDFFAAMGPGASVHRVAGAGHAPHITHAEETGRRIGEFVRALR
ncbi:MAG TPA: alpha/beta fold hydrolase [Gammaproteobacteria bacterium]|nr:alpha/beta fold hydrolase [Gammaproteobacteria bacterium]